MQGKKIGRRKEKILKSLLISEEQSPFPPRKRLLLLLLLSLNTINREINKHNKERVI